MENCNDNGKLNFAHYKLSVANRKNDRLSGMDRQLLKTINSELQGVRTELSVVANQELYEGVCLTTAHDQLWLKEFVSSVYNCHKGGEGVMALSMDAGSEGNFCKCVNRLIIYA